MENKWQNAREQAQAQFESIKEMVATLQIADESAWEKPPTFDGNFDDACEDARQAIHENALSVEVRSGWRCIGVPSTNDTYPAEYRILLCTGGPAVQIMGELSEHGEPETARLMMQDWGLPWTEYRPLSTSKDAYGRPMLVGDAQEILLTYARQFYFSE